MTIAKKRFDCVETKRAGTARILAELEGKSQEEQLEYWQRRNEEMRRKYPQIRTIQKSLPTSH